MTTTLNPARVARTDRRDQLLTAAAELFAEHGYAMTSIDAIGARAGVTGPAVYRHFTGKRDLLLTLLNSAVDSALADIAATTRPGASPQEALEALVRQLVRHAVAERQMIGLLSTQTSALGAADRQRVEKLRTRVVDAWTAALAAARPALGAADVALHVGAALSVITAIALRAPAKPGGEIEDAYVRMTMALLSA